MIEEINLSYLDTFNQLLGDWTLNDYVDYCDWHIGYLQEIGDKYLIAIEKYCDEIDDYFYKSKKWYIPKADFKDRIIEIVKCVDNNCFYGNYGSGIIQEKYHELYREIEKYVEWNNV